ncbi:hypothetical protein BDF22DRAFT_671195 [Syncephalis plumigaleata]|nr:hypothetical protein BDF22DRAFT_671195 [Syncephalis plumigaleata]
MLFSRIKPLVAVRNLQSLWRYNSIVVSIPVSRQHTTILATRIHTIALQHHPCKNNAWRQVMKQLGYKRTYRTTTAASTSSSSSYRNHGNLVTPALISANVLVYAMWTYAKWEQEAQPYTRSKLMTWMRQNFLCGPYNLWQENRWWTLITANFSHSELWHLGLNMFALYSFGPSLAMLLGTKRFLAIYMGCGVSGSLASALFNRWNESKHRLYQYHGHIVSNRPAASHGASASILGVATVFSMLFPQTQFLLFFILPMPGWLILTGLAGWDAYSLVTNKPSVFDHAGHLGGMAGGVGSFALLATRMIRRR